MRTQDPPEKYRAIVITGASTGIGAACALALDELGFRVFAGVRSTADGQALKSRAGPDLLPIELDVTDSACISAAAATLMTNTGKLGLAGLVNNAGIGVVGPLETVALADLRRQFEVNVVGLVAVTQALLPLLRLGRGRIVNIGSIAGRAHSPFMGPYSASKHAVEALTDALRIELQSAGVHVSVIEPGAISTPIWSKTRKEVESWESAWSGETKDLYLEAFTRVKQAASRAEQRAQPPSLVAKAVIHALCSRHPKTRYLVGADAKIRARLSVLLPDRLQDRLLSWFLKLPPRTHV